MLVEILQKVSLKQPNYPSVSMSRSASFLVLVGWIATGMLGSAFTMEMTNKSNSEYFITTPSTTTVMRGLSSSNDFASIGQFQCAIRVGFKLVWVINGVSADLISSRPGFEEVTYELIPLQDSGNTLSILNIPVKSDINGTIVTCTAVYNQSIEAHSQPVYLIVTEADLTESPTHTSVTETEATTAKPNSTELCITEVLIDNDGNSNMLNAVADNWDYAISRETMLGLAVGLCLLSALLAMAMVAICVVAGIIISRRKGLRRLQAREGPRENNIYWAAVNPEAVQQQTSDSDKSKDALRDVPAIFT